MGIVESRYESGEYLGHNPSWDIEDSPWKIKQVLRMLQAHSLTPTSVAEVGCGAGAVLAGLRGAFPEARLYGFDIAPEASGFWQRHKTCNIEFVLGDFFECSKNQYELLLLLDVVEHLSNPFDFLSRLRGHAEYYVFHFPLDLSALSVVREKPLLHVREKVGHIHYFTKGLAIALLEDCGYQIRDWFYTDAALSGPRHTWSARLAGLPRRVAYAIRKDAGVRLLGGETLMVLARARG